MKIRTAIFGSYVVASAVGFAVLMAFVLREVRPRHVESMRHTMAETAGLLAALVGDDVAAGRAPGSAWRADLEGLAPEAGGLRVYATDERGRVTFDSAGGRDVGRDYSRRPEIGGYPLPDDPDTSSASVVDGELRVATPVWRDGVLAGHVGVARSLDAVTDGIRRARLRIAAGGLGVAAAMLVIGWVISQRLTHALERLTAYVGDVRDGRTARRPASRADEVEALGRAFDEMRTALEGKAYVEEYTQALTHELKAPLSAIRGAAELLDEDMPPDERARFLSNLRTEATRLQTIVDRMLQLSALEARRALKEVGRVELFGLLGETIDALRTQAQARRIDVRVDASHAHVNGERFLLGQALSNLLQNAIEFSSPGGVVDVRIRREAGSVGIRIDDDGPGVPEYARTRIFERFYSLPRPDTGRKSTGLGLSFVREIAHLHGGEVMVGNRPKGGARAVLTLPSA